MSLPRFGYEKTLASVLLVCFCFPSGSLTAKTAAVLGAALCTGPRGKELVSPGNSQCGPRSANSLVREMEADLPQTKPEENHKPGQNLDCSFE